MSRPTLNSVMGDLFRTIYKPIKIWSCVRRRLGVTPRRRQNGDHAMPSKMQQQPRFLGLEAGTKVLLFSSSSCRLEFQTSSIISCLIFSSCMESIFSGTRLSRQVHWRDLSAQSCSFGAAENDDSINLVARFGPAAAAVGS